MNKVNLQSAFLLQSRAYRDTSALIEIVTPDHGRISLVARGVKSGNSKSRGMLQPFRRLLISWSGDKELKSLTTVEEDGVASCLKGDALVSAMYLNELLVRLLHRNEGHETLFSSYQNTLLELERALNIPKTLRIFEKNLLQELGYGLMLEYDADSGEPIDENGEYTYQVESGPVGRSVPGNNSSVYGSIAKENTGITIQGKSLLSLFREDLDDPRSLKECKKLLRYIINFYLDGVPIKSRDILAVSY